MNAALAAAPVRWLTEEQAARYCLYHERGCADPVRAFQKWARRKAIPVRRVARARQYNPAILDAFMQGETWTKRHAEPAPKPRLSVVHGRHSVASRRMAEGGKH